jgi:hypothetical protein
MSLRTSLKILKSPHLPFYCDLGAFFSSSPHRLVPLQKPAMLPRLSSIALQHFKNRWPLFLLFRFEKASWWLPTYQEVTHSGFLDPRCVFTNESLAAFFICRRSWASPFRALVLSNDSMTFSKPPFRSCTSVALPVLQRLAPIRKAVFSRCAINTS